MPIVRTVATVLAGVGRMRFAVYAALLDHRRCRVGRRRVAARLWLGNVSFVKQHQKTVTSLIDPVIIAVVVLVTPAGRDPLVPRAASELRGQLVDDLLAVL